MLVTETVRKTNEKTVVKKDKKLIIQHCTLWHNMHLLTRKNSYIFNFSYYYHYYN